MTNLTPVDLERLQSMLQAVSSTWWNSGRRKRCSYSSLHVLFMALTVYKNGGAWDFLTSLYKIKLYSFQLIVTKFVDTVNLYAYKQLVENAQYFTMKHLAEINQQFLRYPQVLYATDAIFQQCYRPCGIVEGTKSHVSKIHHLYCMKAEFSVLPNELATSHSCTYPGATADVAIFRSNSKWHEE